MDFLEKARVRLEHWLEHNAHHQEDYEEFAKVLESEGKHESAAHVREMAALTVKSNQALKKAIQALEG